MNVQLADHSKPIVVEFEVEPGARFAGREVRELGLPPGCVLVRCHADGREWVPVATTRLYPHTRITAFITPEAKDALLTLRQGREAKNDNG